ncbi:hypothetical protein [Haloplasma contractile]|uniref:Uncharacterized protein n=1 Tax=Haloplasma contractile SSD-17B TaxID=1033810 RepID=U2EAI0_9MOLU|nr:hypothetical protein [Haloplasma contractile]ERJ11836.1 hypothetical protein HLPCO_002075 [Haloplasma contractile SSD-17B]
MYSHACSCIGRPTVLRTRAGRTYRGYVERVTPRGVYYRAKGLSVGFFPFFSIASIVLLSALFWY